MTMSLFSEYRDFLRESSSEVANMRRKLKALEDEVARLNQLIEQ